MRRAVVGAVALCLIGGGSARAQGAEDLGTLLAVMQEHFGQSMGEAVVGGQSIFVTAKGSAKLGAPAPRAYDLTADAQAPTAVQAAKLRDDKIEKLRAVAKRFSVQMTVGEGSYVTAGRFPLVRPVATAPGVAPPVQTPPNTPLATPSTAQVTARAPVTFVRPPPAQMPAFIDALREAGIETLPDTSAPPNGLAQLTQILGLGGAASSPTVDQETWDRASAAAVQAARAQAEALAGPAGRRVGAVRQIMLLTRGVQGGEATVTVAARFGFAAEK